MATKKNTKGARRRKPKGKRLSEALAEKDARKQELEQEAAEAEEAALAAQEAAFDDELASDEAQAAAGLEDQDADALDNAEVDADDDFDSDLEQGDLEQGDLEQGASADDDEDEILGEDEEWEYEDEDDELVAAQMGVQRYVLFGFMALWLVSGYIAGRTVEALWSNFAAKDWFVLNVPFLATVPHEGLLGRGSVSLLVGGVIAALIVGYYFKNPDTRQWADEVAEELTKVEWPNRKQIGNHTVVVIAASAVITAYLALLDRFWSFVTNLIYSAGA